MSFTSKYEFEKLDYSVADKSGIVSSDLEKLDDYLHTYIEGVAGETISTFEPVYLKSDGKYYKAQAVDGPARGLSIESAELDETFRIQRVGPITNTSWSFPVVGNPVYLGLSGGLTTTKPDSHVQIIGYVLSSQSLFIIGNLKLDGLLNIVDDNSPQLGGELDCQNHSIGWTQQEATGDGTTTIDWKNGNVFKFTFGAQNETFTFTAPSKPGWLTLLLIQDETGGRSATWPGSVKWPGGTSPTLSTGAGAIDKIDFYFDGSNFYGEAKLNFS